MNPWSLPEILRTAVVALATFGLVAGCGGGGRGDREDGGSETDAGADAGDDQGSDLGADVDGGSCSCADPFEHCVGGRCVAYPICFQQSTCPEGTICTGRHCVPEDVDIDGDTYPASTDCDEEDPAVNPGATEVCGFSDDNCSGEVDEGDTSELCATDPTGDVCMFSVCCPANTYNFDMDPGNACECNASPTPGTGAACGSAIFIGAVSDAGEGQTRTVSNNILPYGREVWYRFTATDAADTSCDNFYTRVRFLENPSDRYVFNVYRGCDTVMCDAGTGYTDFTWKTDFRSSSGAPRTGQCPCGGTVSDTTNTCDNDSADFMIRVRWKGGATASCDPFTIEVTNGVFSS